MRIVHSFGYTQFEWDSSKAEWNRLKHGISFDDAAEALVCPHLEYGSSRSGELRTLAVCRHLGRVVSVIYTTRGEKCRIISARPARDYEQREYRFIFDRGDP